MATNVQVTGPTGDLHVCCYHSGGGGAAVHGDAPAGEVNRHLAPGPNMVFPVATENSLSPEVFVNGRDRLIQPMMQALLREKPGDVRVEYNFLGDISEFLSAGQSWRAASSPRAASTSGRRSPAGFVCVSAAHGLARPHAGSRTLFWWCVATTR